MPLSHIKKDDIDDSGNWMLLSYIWKKAMAMTFRASVRDALKLNSKPKLYFQIAYTSSTLCTVYTSP
jgi:hypothetical protein